MQRCECGDEDCDAERLWSDFEQCAQTVTRLYSDPTWKTMQTAAASTTQLYKNGLDSHRKAFDKGFEEGRRSLVKELISACGGKIDLNRLLEVLGQGSGRSRDDVYRQRANSNSRSTGISSEGAAAVQLFHQALSPSSGHGSSPQRSSSELNTFLTTQIQRRKRARSPSSPSQVLKKLKRM